MYLFRIFVLFNIIIKLYHPKSYIYEHFVEKNKYLFLEHIYNFSSIYIHRHSIIFKNIKFQALVITLGTVNSIMHPISR